MTQKFYSQLYELGQTPKMLEYGEKVGFKLEKTREQKGRCSNFSLLDSAKHVAVDTSAIAMVIKRIEVGE